MTMNMRKSQSWRTCDDWLKKIHRQSVQKTLFRKKKHDECHRNQNIIWKKKNITDILIFRIQKKSKYAFNHNA